MSTPVKKALIVQPPGRQETVWRAALQSQGLETASIARGESLAALAAPRSSRSRTGDVLIVDLAELAAEGLRLPEYGRALRAARPEILLVATLGACLDVSEPERRWARAHGALDLYPAMSMTHAASQTLAHLRALLAALGCDRLDMKALQRDLLRVANEAADADGDIVARLASRGVDAGDVARRLRGPEGVPLAKRRYRLKWYPRCFVGSDAVRWLESNCRLAHEEALDLGQFLLERGAIHHVVKEQSFIDGPFYYRLGGADAKLDAIEIDPLVARIRGAGGVPIKNRTHRGQRYAACFVGRAAVDWMAKSYGLEREDAVTLGQRLVDLCIIHHVVHEHEFVDGHYFYRFLGDATS